MRIFVVSDLPDFVTGGAEMQAARLIEAWLDAGHQVRCFGRRMGRGPVQIGRHSVAVSRIRTTSALGRWGRAASYFLSLAWLLLRNRRWLDVVYTRFLGEAAATAAVLKAMGLLHQPLVATPANTRGDGDTNLLRSLPLGHLWVGLLDRNCDAINLIADGMVEELREAGFSGGTFTRIPNGIPIRALARGPAPASPKFVAVGRLSRQKGYDVLLKALSLVRDRLGAGQIAIVGDGPERSPLLQQADELQLAGKITWRGELSQPEISKLLEHSQIFLLPSRYEGMSNAGLEAMERGLPMILTSCGGLDRHIDPDLGWVVPAEDAKALSDAILCALEVHASALAEMGLRAREYAVETFDMNVVASQYLGLFQSLIDRRSTVEAPVDV